MVQVAQDTQQDFWRPPALDGEPEAVVPAVLPMAEVCSLCQTEFMIGSRFCHTCGAHRRPNSIVSSASSYNVSAAYDLLARKLSALRPVVVDLYQGVTFPAWLRYLHFHEIRDRIGLPTPSLIAFLIGLLCVVGAISVGLFYKASNLAEFQAIQMWRIEWLLAAIASFVAGILLKNPSSKDPN